MIENDTDGAAERISEFLHIWDVATAYPQVIATAFGNVHLTFADLRALLDEREQVAIATARAEAKLAHSESVVEAFHAEADRLSDLLDAARDDVQRYRTGYELLRARIAELGQAETEYRFVQPDGTASEFDLHNGPCGCQRQARVGDGPWLAAGGWVSADAAPLEPRPAAFTLPPREALERLAAEQGVRPVVHINDLAAAPEGRLSGEEVEAFLFALREACGTELDDLDILLAVLMRRLGDEVELSQDEIEDARRRLRDEEWHFVSFRASFLAPDLVTVKMRSRPRAGKPTTDRKEPTS